MSFPIKYHLFPQYFLSGNSLISETSRKILEQKKLDLQKNSDKMLTDMVSYMEDKMGKDGWKRFNQATKQQAELQIEAKRVLNDASISEDQKQKMLKDLKTKFDYLQNARKILRNRNLASRIPEIKTILEDRIITLTFIQKFKTKNLKFLIFRIRITTEIRIFHK